MGLFAIADLHLGFSVNKPMDIFGEAWENHSEKIIKNWKREVGEGDTVLIAGDISWGMREEEAYADLDMIDGLPGRKILLEGNHDYWWKSASKLERKYPDMKFMKNNSAMYEDGVFICGTRGWVCPNDTAFTPQDEKIYNREQMRLRLSLEHAMRQGAKEIILMMHYPPVNDKQEDSAILEMIKQYPIKNMVYGHLHQAKGYSRLFIGEKGDITFDLVAADFIDFCPKRIR